MYLSKTKRSPYYQIIYWENGKRTSISTCKKTKQEALSFLSEFEKNLAKKKKVKPVSLADFQKEYIEQLSLTKSTAYIEKSVKIAFKQFILYLGNEKILLRKIKNREAEKFILEIYSRAKYSSLLYLRTLKAAFNKAVLWNYIKENPFAKVKAPKIESNFPVFIDNVELNKILEFVKEDYLRLLYLTAYYTGMRLSEIINLRWNAVDFESRFITVKNTEGFTTKSKKERMIPIPNVLFNKLILIKPKIISINRNDNDFVFYRVKGVALNSNFVSKKFKQAVLRAEVNSKVHFHTLRHSYASNLARRGVPLLIIKELLGHQSIRTTEIYSHLQQTDLVEAVNKLNVI